MVLTKSFSHIHIADAERPGDQCGQPRGGLGARLGLLRRRALRAPESRGQQLQGLHGFAPRQGDYLDFV